MSRIGKILSIYLMNISGLICIIASFLNSGLYGLLLLIEGFAVYSLSLHAILTELFKKVN